MKKTELDALYTYFNHPKWRRWDPISVMDFSLEPRDFELLSLLLASLSYGRVEQIQKSFLELLVRLSSNYCGESGSGLVDNLANFTQRDFKRLEERTLRGFKHRLNTAADIALFFKAAAKLYKSHSSLCRFFQTLYLQHNSPKERITAFASAFHTVDLGEKMRADSRKWAGTGLGFMLPSPEKGAAKRLLMWMRWMLRKDKVDPGTWQSAALLDPKLSRPTPADLFCPIDTHIMAWAREQKITHKKSSATWRDVEKVTAHFKSISPHDPTRYDFALCHYGILKTRKALNAFRF